MSRFQSFDEASDRAHSAARIAALRLELARHGVDGFVVPRADRHQGEYVPACDERLAFLTGFSGSAGSAVVLKDTAAIFVDGRYTLAVHDQIDAAVVTAVPVAELSPEDWLRRHLASGDRLGYDPWLLTPDQVKRLGQAVEAAGAALVALDNNPVDAVWGDRRPAPPMAPVRPRDPVLAGEATADRLARIAAALGDGAKAGKGADALLVSDPHALAWAFNLRGGDVGHTPLPLGFALIPASGEATLFFAPERFANRDALAGLATLVAPDGLDDALADVGRGGGTVLFDAATAPARLVQVVEAAGGTARVGRDPIALMKARKNPAELAGTRDAHRRDGAAVTRFLAWMARHATPGALNEIAAAERLEAFRAETGALLDLAFPTISAAGANSAIPHYRVTRASNRRLERGIYLVDSGAQYEDGTTDITRTLGIGEPTVEHRDRFTRVLKGHIAISRAVFPKGTTGAQIDALARLPLWQAGLDFDHGTGHGVGVYLSVHEGPQRLSKAGHVALEEGMILSNEPGYYKGGDFGIRIENLVVVEPRPIEGAERPMLGFATITLAPYDRALIEAGMLDRGERAWIDGYHARVAAEIEPLVPPDVRAWLAEATRPL